MEPSVSSRKTITEAVERLTPLLQSTMSSSVSVVTIDNLPLELLETIINKLDDRASVLNCRLVNSEWKTAAGKAMENFCLSIWTRWNPTETRERPFPKICRTTIFPFPTRSLYIDSSSWKEYKKTNKATKIEIFKLLKLFGSHLTSLWIDGFSLDPVQISIMFREFLNLKALTISDIHKWDETAELTTYPPPNLQYLGLMWISIHLAQWILEQCSSQLVSFEVFMVISTRQSRSHLKLPLSSGTDHLRFTKLKLCGVPCAIFDQIVRLPLTHLSIDFLNENDYLTPLKTLKDIITFLNNFSGTLVQLYLDVALEDREDGGIIPFIEFPRLTELFIYFLAWGDTNGNRLTYLHEVFLKRFPNLQRLHLLNCDLFGDEREMDVVRGELDSLFRIQHCFQLCPKLETVTVNQLVATGQEFEITVSRNGDQLWKLHNPLISIR